MQRIDITKIPGKKVYPALWLAKEMSNLPKELLESNADNFEEIILRHKISPQIARSALMGMKFNDNHSRLNLLILALSSTSRLSSLLDINVDTQKVLLEVIRGKKTDKILICEDEILDLIAAVSTELNRLDLLDVAAKSKILNARSIVELNKDHVLQKFGGYMGVYTRIVNEYLPSAPIQSQDVPIEIVEKLTVSNVATPVLQIQSIESSISRTPDLYAAISAFFGIFKKKNQVVESIPRKSTPSH